MPALGFMVPSVIVLTSEKLTKTFNNLHSTAGFVVCKKVILINIHLVHELRSFRCSVDDLSVKVEFK